MSRTEGSGWGGGTLFYQPCPLCGKKKVLYDPCMDIPPYKCTACKERFHSNALIDTKYLSVVIKKRLQLKGGIESILTFQSELDAALEKGTEKISEKIKEYYSKSESK